MEKSKKNKVLFAILWAVFIILGVLTLSLLYVFVWKVPTYTISLSSNIDMQDILQGEGEYARGDEVTITASKVDGYSFVNWTYNDNIVSDDYTYTFIISDKNYGTYKANYQQRDYSIKIQQMNGSVEVKESAKAGESVLIENIIPDKGYMLERMYYSEYGSVEMVEIKDNTFIMPASSITIYVIFEPVEYRIEVATDENYKLNILQSNANYQQEIEVYAEAIYGYEISKIYYLSEDGTTQIEILNNKFNMPAYSVKIYAEVQIANYTITYNLNGGEVSNLVYTYTIFTTPIIVPNPTREGYVFLGWIGDGLTIATKDLIIDGVSGNMELSALWEKISN